jgi:hypothetical protein
MSRLVAFLRSLGTDGAARNARILLEARREERLVVDRLVDATSTRRVA